MSARRDVSPATYEVQNRALRKLYEAVAELLANPPAPQNTIDIQQVGDEPALLMCTDGGCELATSYEVADVIAALIPFLASERQKDKRKWERETRKREAAARRRAFHSVRGNR